MVEVPSRCVIFIDQKGARERADSIIRDTAKSQGTGGPGNVNSS